MLTNHTPITVVIPTYNAGNQFRECAEILAKQTANIIEVLIIDSSSTDETANIARDFGFTVDVIPKCEFGHGKTRQYALEKAQSEIVVFMTQDALLKDVYSIERLILFFNEDHDLAAVYGRQIAYPHTDIFGKFARIYNYSSNNHIRSFNDKDKIGFKTAFFSDTFGVYKKNVVLELEGFPNVQFGEDTCMAGKMLQAGYKIGYCANALVYHSHTYGVLEEYERCKEIGIFHKREKWLLEIFGKPEGEGLRFIVSEIKYLLNNGKFYLLPLAFIRNLSKFLGYRVGYAK